jgi:hypothetical protein
MGRAKDVTFGAMRAAGVQGVLVHCLACGRWRRLGRAECAKSSDNIKLSDIEPKFVCEACGKHGADVSPDFDWQMHDRP